MGGIAGDEHIEALLPILPEDCRPRSQFIAEVCKVVLKAVRAHIKEGSPAISVSGPRANRICLMTFSFLSSQAPTVDVAEHLRAAAGYGISKEDATEIAEAALGGSFAEEDLRAFCCVFFLHPRC